VAEPRDHLGRGVAPQDRLPAHAVHRPGVLAVGQHALAAVLDERRAAGAGGERVDDALQLTLHGTLPSPPMPWRTPAGTLTRTWTGTTVRHGPRTAQAPGSRRPDNSPAQRARVPAVVR